jgi:hypothetical protein
MKRLGTMLALMLTAALMAPAGVGAEEEQVDDPRFPTEWHVVADGNAGTFGGDPELATIGHELGADLTEARIRMPDADHVDFQIQTTNLPAMGGVPEVIRYTWDMLVDTGEGPREAQIDGKFSNYSRGVCDPTAGCDPTDAGGDSGPKDPGERPFFWRGDLEQLDLGATTFNAMKTYATLPGDFAVDDGTITISVPTEAISMLDGVEWGDCSQILPGAGLRGGVVESSLAAWLTSGAFPSDVLMETWDTDPVFTAPPAADAEVDCDGNPIEAE